MPQDSSDVLLVTATKVETEAVLAEHRRLTGRRANQVTRDERTYYDLGIINNVAIALAMTEMGSNGAGSAQDTVRRAIHAIQPTSVIMVGIAFGVDERRQAMGTVLVAEQIIPYELQRVGAAATLSRSPQPGTSSRLRQFFKARQHEWKEGPQAFGPLLSGEKLVDNIEFRDELKARYPEAIGGEMEGHGLYVACDGTGADWILVKAICDWADGVKNHPDKKQRQLDAARLAVSCVFDVITSCDLRKRRPAPATETTPFRLDWRFAGGFSSLDRLLVQLPESPIPGVTRYEACRDVMLRSRPELATEQAFDELAREIFDQHIRQQAGKHRVQLQDAQSALLVAHELMNRYSRFGRTVRARSTRTAGSRLAIPKHFERVYPNTVNTFVKDIVSLSLDPQAVARLRLSAREADIARGAKYIIEGSPLKNVSRDSAGPEVHAAYTLGRTRPPAPLEARRALLDFEVRTSKTLASIQYGDEDKARHFYLMRRTAILSQAMLGDLDRAEIYLQSLLDDRVESDANAGFHLEYYGDQPFDETLPLCSRDRRGKCENTLAFLGESLNRGLAHKDLSSQTPLWRIELYTLTSVAAHRLSTPWRSTVEPVMKLLRQVLDYLQPDDLKLYVQQCVELYEAAPGRAVQLLGSYLSAKNAPRNGWVERGVQFPETVGAHTASAIWLANLIPEGERINMSRVKDMLEVHDLAEGITGDITKTRKADEDDETERQLMRRLSWLGTYIDPQMDLYSLYASYREFQRNQTEDAKLANEIDWIDIVLQGNAILNSKATFDREKVRALVDKMEAKIQTKVGRYLLGLARQMNVISESSFRPTIDSPLKRYYFGAVDVEADARV